MRRLWKDECGQDMIEYALVVAVIAVGMVTGSQSLRVATANMLEAVADRVSVAGTVT